MSASAAGLYPGERTGACPPRFRCRCRSEAGCRAGKIGPRRSGRRWVRCAAGTDGRCCGRPGPPAGQIRAARLLREAPGLGRHFLRGTPRFAAGASWLAAAAAILTWLYIVLLHFGRAALAHDPMGLIVVAGIGAAALLAPLFQFIARSCWEYGSLALFDPLRWRGAVRTVADEIRRSRGAGASGRRRHAVNQPRPEHRAHCRRLVRLHQFGWSLRRRCRSGGSVRSAQGLGRVQPWRAGCSCVLACGRPSLGHASGVRRGTRSGWE